MQTLIEIGFHGMTPSPRVETMIREGVARLERFDRRLHRCAVTIDLPHRHQRSGKQFHVGILLTVPDAEIAVSRDPGIGAAHEDLYVAIADAFRAARRQLQDHRRIQRGEVKTHEGREAR